MALHELIRGNERMALEDELTRLWNRRYLFGVLEQLEDEVRPVVVAVGEQHRADAPDVGAVAPPVLLANRLVVRSHGHPSRSGTDSGAKFAQVRHS